MEIWMKKTQKMRRLKKEVNIGIVGKYFKSGKFDLKDSYVSVLEAINHASWDLGVKAVIHWISADDFSKNNGLQKELLKMDGIVVPQGWGSRGAEGKIRAVQIARESKIPYLGLCYGMQMAVIEYARNVLGIKDANSQEVNPKSKDLVIHLMESQKKLLKDGKFGGTIRLGAWPCKIERGSLLESLYIKYSNTLFHNLPTVMERHRHRYEFNNEYKERLESAGLILSGKSLNGSLIEAIELSKKNHPFFLATQYHPELKSRFIEPHPIFMGFIKAAIKKSRI
jgi:CTP synthase